MAEIKLTSEQQKAIEINKNLTLSANAGSGKTKVLIDRYMQHIITGNCSAVKRVVAITFTEKAAREMLERLHKKILEYYPTDVRLHRSLLNAKISTIHSFCFDILKEYSFESGLLPSVRLLDEVDVYNLKRRAKLNVFDDLLNNDEVIDSDLDLVFSYYQVDALTNIIDILLRSRDIYEQIKELYNKQEEEYCEIIYKKFYEQSKDDVLLLLEALKHPVKHIYDLQFSDGNKKQRAEELYDIIICDDVFDREINYNDYLLLVKDLVEFCEIKQNNRFLFGNMLDNIDGIKATDYRKDFIEKYKCASNFDNLSLQYKIAKQVLFLADKIKLEIDAHKQRLNGIDFDDMLHLTKELLKDKEIASAIASQYDEIMVDEFQDTNNTQYAIIKSLVPLNDANAKPNLFIVGDEKQSIYRFRYADVEVFKNVQKDIAKCNTGNDEISKESGNLQLTTTFRSMPIITGFVNYICNSIFSKIEVTSNMSYTDLICGNKSRLEGLLPIRAKQFLDDRYGSIKFLLSIKSKTDNEEENNEDEDINEAKLVGQYIKHIVNTSNYTYKDIGILFRSRSKTGKLFNALLEERIPFTNASGAGFFDKPEIYSLVIYLKMLLSLQDDTSLLGVMLSPFFYALSPSDVLEIKAEPGDVIWDKLSTYCKKEYAKHNIKDMYKKIKELSTLSTSISITHLLRAILNQPNWIYAINKTSEAKQKQITENVEKFIGIAREFQNKGYYNLSDFIIDIQIRTEITSKESEATITDADSVKLLTIHAAKGLEFPIVILYDTNSKGQNIKLPLVDKEYGIAMNIPTSENNFTKQKDTIANYIIETIEKQKEDAEKLRQIYVALTRASEHLILSASLKETKEGYVNNKNSFFRLIANAIGLNDTTIKNIIDNNLNDKQALNVTIKILDEPVVNAEINYDIITSVANEMDAFTYINDKIKNNKIAENISVEEKYIQEPLIYKANTIIETETNHIFSASALKDLRNIEVETKYYYNKINNYIISGTDKGNGFHYLMEHFNEWYNNKIDEEKLKNITIKFLNKPDYYQFNTTENINMFIKLCNDVVNTKFIQRYKSALKEAKFEYEFLMPNKDNFIGGIIDCIVKDENKNWFIIDWKTNHSPDINKLRKEYELQIKMYIYILMHLYDQLEYSAYLCFTEAAKIDADDDEWTAYFCYKLSDKNILYNEILELTEYNSKKIIA